MNEDRVLLLLFHIKEQQFALLGEQVVEVAPLATLEAIPHAPPEVAGLLHYRDRLVPVIDLSQLLRGEPCSIKMSTRLILVHYPEEGESSHVLGLMAERVTETITKQHNEALDPAFHPHGAPYLGELYEDETGLVRRIRVADVLTEELRNRLFQEQHP